MGSQGEVGLEGAPTASYYGSKGDGVASHMGPSPPSPTAPPQHPQRTRMTEGSSSPSSSRKSSTRSMSVSAATCSSARDSHCEEGCVGEGQLVGQGGAFLRGGLIALTRHRQDEPQAMEPGVKRIELQPLASTTRTEVLDGRGRLLDRQAVHLLRVGLKVPPELCDEVERRGWNFPLSPHRRVLIPHRAPAGD